MSSIPPTQVKTNIAENGKSREQILAEREAKKLAKQAKKMAKTETTTEEIQPSSVIETAVETNSNISLPTTSVNKTAEVQSSESQLNNDRQQIKADREAKKQAKQALKIAKASGVKITELSTQLSQINITSEKQEKSNVPTEIKSKPQLTKAERRAIQETQRAAKLQSKTQSTTSAKTKSETKATTDVVRKSKDDNQTLVSATTTSSSPKRVTINLNPSNFKLFNHLKHDYNYGSHFVNNPQIHPSIASLGEQYSKRTVVGSNARCIAFLNAMKIMIQDYVTPHRKEFTRSLEATITHCVDHLQKCRPLAVSVTNAYKHIKHMLTQLPNDKPESELKENLCHFIETYIENQIDKAAQAISSAIQQKIKDGDVILTFGCSSLIYYILEEAHNRNVKFRVIVVDSRPFNEGQELLRRLTVKQISCTYVLINAITYVMPEVSKVLLGAHALLSNGYVMARTGTAQVALVARSFNVPVLVCCETHKFSERFQTDAIVYNELGDPDDLIIDNKCCLTNWQAKSKLTPLNLIYDVTPPELVTAVVTEISTLPCTSVPVILRIKPTEIYN